MIDYDLLIRIEMLIHYAKIDEKGVWIKRMIRLNSNEDGEKMVKQLLELRQIMGFDATPHTLSEQKKAIQFSVDKDDYHEQRFKGG